jgi:hypothetical protein
LEGKQSTPEDTVAGRKIDDHGSWIGKGGSHGPLPMESKMKQEHSADGAGSLNMDYPDTTEHIHRDQEKGQSKVHGHKMKPGYRY